ncbi:hypothetical protein MTO96_014075 [Rhipicephalus appendiculatus]
MTLEAYQRRGLAAARVGPPLRELPSTVDDPPEDPLGGGEWTAQTSRLEKESLYCQTLSVQLKDDYCATSRRVSSVCLAIRRTNSSIIGRKELHIQLTDDADPFFFYTLTLTEDDFQSLKAQQGLLVDFLAFPQKFIDLLELCTKDEQKDSPRFVLSLTVHGRIGSDPAILGCC